MILTKESFKFMNNTYSELIPTIYYFVEKQCSPSWNLEKSKIPFYDLLYLVEGETYYYVNDTLYHLKKGDLLLNKKGNYRQAYTNSNNPMYCYAFNFTYEFLDGVKKDLPLATKFTIGLDYEFLENCRKFNQIWLEKKSGYLLESRAIFMLILHRLIHYYGKNKEKKQEDNRIEKIKEYILTNFQKNLKIKDLAKLVHLNPVYLGSLFKKETKITINEYINQIRINKAYDLLASGEKVSETSYQIGFNDPFYFCKKFKEIKGFPPSQINKTKNKLK